MGFIDFHRFSLIFIDFHRILFSAVTEQVTRTTRGDSLVVAGTATHRPRAVGTPQTPRERNEDAPVKATWGYTEIKRYVNIIVLSQGFGLIIKKHIYILRI